MEKLKLSDLENREDWKYAVIVFKSESFNKKYSLKERSYLVCKDNKWFNPAMIGRSLYGNCLDGKDKGVRLDWYMYDEKKPWIVDYCYIISDKELEVIKNEQIR